MSILLLFSFAMDGSQPSINDSQSPINCVQVFQKIQEAGQGEMSPEKILSFKMFLKDLEILLALQMEALSRPSERAALPDLTPAFLFERPARLPPEFLRQLTQRLAYLRDCGVTPNMVRDYFIKNWARIKSNPVLLDVGCDVSLCHVQAAVNQVLLSQYSRIQPEQIPSHVMAYFSFCLLLSDHSEIREGKGSFSYLHHPEHAKGLKNPETFPLSGTVGAKSKKMEVTSFFPRLRMVVASQALLFVSDGRAFPTTFPHEISGVPVPKTAYPETFCLFFGFMERYRMPFLVDLVHIVSPSAEGEEPQLLREFGVGAHQEAESFVNIRGKEDNVLVMQMFTVGLSEEDRKGILTQLCKFDIIKAVITETVRQAHTKEALVGTAVAPDGVSGWLQSVFNPDTARATSLFDDKFCALYVKKAIESKRVGIAPRHLYCTTVGALEKELPLQDD